jgi:hypothetical protein
MKCPLNARVYVAGAALGIALFVVAWDGFFWLLRELGYVDGGASSMLVAVLFLTCMLVMCVGYGVGIAMFVSRRLRRPSGPRAA